MNNPKIKMAVFLAVLSGLIGANIFVDIKYDNYFKRDISTLNDVSNCIQNNNVKDEVYQCFYKCNYSEYLLNQWIYEIGKLQRSVYSANEYNLYNIQVLSLDKINDIIKDVGNAKTIYYIALILIPFIIYLPIFLLFVFTKVDPSLKRNGSKLAFLIDKNLYPFLLIAVLYYVVAAWFGADEQEVTTRVVFALLPLILPVLYFYLRGIVEAVNVSVFKKRGSTAKLLKYLIVLIKFSLILAMTGMVLWFVRDILLQREIQVLFYYFGNAWV